MGFGSDKNGFAKQLKFSGTCSRHALRHALLCLGIPTSEVEISAAMNASRAKCAITGLDEFSILDGITANSCRGTQIHERSADVALARMDLVLGRAEALVICVSEWSHWAVLCGKEDDEYLWIDSADSALFGTMKAEKLSEWLHCDGEELPFYGISIVPKVESQLAYSLVGHFRELFEALEDSSIRKSWGSYLHSALRALRPTRNGDTGAEEFFSYYREHAASSKILHEISEGELNRLEIVSSAHRLKLSSSEVLPAIARISALIAN
jgi:hypothetical protein